MKSFEEKVRERFEENNIKSIADFAQKVGVSERGMRKIFQREDCKFSLIKKMSEVLNVSLTYFA